MSTLSNVLYAFRTTNLREGVEADPISRWVVITRASVFPMTFFAGAIGGLLAIPGGHAQLVPWILCTVGLVLAHAVNNMVNDYIDVESGVDTPDYARALYAPHPILSGWVTKGGLLRAILLVKAIDGVGSLDEVTERIKQAIG